MKNVLFTYCLFLLLGISSLALSSTKEDGVFNNSSSLSIEIVYETGEMCENLQLNSYSNSVVFDFNKTVFAESPIFTTYLNRAKKLRISALNRICTGFISTRKV